MTRPTIPHTVPTIPLYSGAETRVPPVSLPEPLPGVTYHDDRRETAPHTPLRGHGRRKRKEARG
jgi:hypothetical protein